MLKAGTTAIHLLCRGPQVPESGKLPLGGMIANYLIEVEEHQEAAE
jgi:hypothetical protein